MLLEIDRDAETISDIAQEALLMSAAQQKKQRVDTVGRDEAGVTVNPTLTASGDDFTRLNINESLNAENGTSTSAVGSETEPTVRKRPRVGEAMKRFMESISDEKNPYRFLMLNGVDSTGRLMLKRFNYSKSARADTCTPSRDQEHTKAIEYLKACSFWMANNI